MGKLYPVQILILTIDVIFAVRYPSFTRMMQPLPDFGCKLDNVELTSNEYCNFTIECSETTSSFQLLLHRNIFPYRTCGAYILSVNIHDIFYDSATFDDMKGFTDSIKEIHIENAEGMESVPKDIFEFVNLTHITLTNSTIEHLNLNEFLVLDYLTKINISRNSIVSIKMDTEEAETLKINYNSSVTVIDLSYNLIENIEVYSFTHFQQLRHLNLSHNDLSTLEPQTFEGLSQLQVLHLEHNKLHTIGNSLEPLVKVEEISLSHNHIYKVNEEFFFHLTNLKKLNLSSNYIKNIEELTFYNLKVLEELDLSNNLIKMTSAMWFTDNIHIRSLSLANNEIQYIEPDTFTSLNISDFSFENNPLSGVIQKNTFQGLRLNALDLSKLYITEIGPEAFSTLPLQYLNLSTNCLTIISESAFSSMILLKELDLSNNNLDNLQFETTSLQNLTLLNAQNNTIEKVPRNTFKNLSSLKTLHLSNNSISEIEDHTFLYLNNLEILTLNNNFPLISIQKQIFEGLWSLIYLDISFTGITMLGNNAFYGLNCLEHFNISHSALSHIDQNAFRNTSSIKILDLSFNALEHFSINASTISKVRHLYLNNNKITNIAKDTFLNLHNLVTLHLSNNYIAEINEISFVHLLQLRELYFDSMTQISTDIFDKIYSLETLVLANNTGISFKNTSNVHTKNLDLSLCNIENLDEINIYRVKNLKTLTLKSNKIQSLSKHSFQNMSSLISLDLSLNLISYIQPGTFLYTKNLKSLNLHGNNITTFEYGTFTGLEKLEYLNLSNNALPAWPVKDIRFLPSLTILALDNNFIKDIALHFGTDNMRTLTIGGNPISCSSLEMANVYRTPININITAASLDFHSENINGISCENEPQKRYNGYPPVYLEQNITRAIENFLGAIKTLVNKNVDLQANVTGSYTIASNSSLDEKISKILDKKIEKYVQTKNQVGISYVQIEENKRFKSLLYIIIACLIMIVVMLMCLFRHKLINFKRSFSLYNRSNSNQPFINSLEMS